VAYEIRVFGHDIQMLGEQRMKKSQYSDRQIVRAVILAKLPELFYTAKGRTPVLAGQLCRACNNEQPKQSKPMSHQNSTGTVTPGSPLPPFWMPHWKLPHSYRDLIIAPS